VHSIASISLRGGDTGGNVDDCENKGLVEMAIRNNMKGKGLQIDPSEARVTGLQTVRGRRAGKLLILLGGSCWVHATPGVFEKEAANH
jgi:hypothetical protein